jgi:hypothetical protein
MRRELTAAKLLPVTGHAAEAPGDYYNRRIADVAAPPDSARAAADALFK